MGTFSTDDAIVHGRRLQVHHASPILILDREKLTDQWLPKRVSVLFGYDREVIRLKAHEASDWVNANSSDERVQHVFFKVLLRL